MNKKRKDYILGCLKCSNKMSLKHRYRILCQWYKTHEEIKRCKFKKDETVTGTERDEQIAFNETAVFGNEEWCYESVFIRGKRRTAWHDRLWIKNSSLKVSFRDVAFLIKTIREMLVKKGESVEEYPDLVIKPLDMEIEKTESDIDELQDKLIRLKKQRLEREVEIIRDAFGSQGISAEEIMKLLEEP